MRKDVAPQKFVAVVVPLSHKTTYLPNEELGFRHIRHYLSRYDKYVLIPEEHPGIYPGFIPKRFPRRFFGDPRAQGRLLLSEAFYSAFLDYEYILICHLDTLVFRDDLLDWCRAGYDFVGGAGFSLRRVRSFLRVIHSPEYFVEPDEYWRNYCARTAPIVRVFNWPRKVLKRLGYFNDVRWHIRWSLRGDVREDRFWALFATKYDPAFRLAPADAAERFAFEADPRAAFERTARLPFGSHRWNVHDRAFYEPVLLHSGAGSEVFVRPVREARRDWDQFTSLLARMATPSLLP
jgi:hypothetical protein